MMICICSQFCKGFAYGNKDDMCNKDLFVYSRLHCWTSQSPSSRHAFIDGFSMIFHYKPSLLGTTIYENLHIVDRKNHLCDGQTHMWKDDPSASYRSTTSSCSCKPKRCWSEEAEPKKQGWVFFLNPDAPCMEYLHTFTPTMTQM